MSTFFLDSWHILLALAPWLLLGAAIAGVLHVMLPENFLRRQLSGRGSVPKAVGLGVPLPLCSCGVIPVALQLKQGGASPGAVVAFLISTPQTGADSILVSASMLGWPLAIFKVASAALTGLVGGWITDARTSNAEISLPIAEASAAAQRRSYFEIVTHGLELIRSLWGWLVLGVLVSAAITSLLPTAAMEGLREFSGLGAMLMTLVISVPLYVCATASVPIAAALVAAGLPTGAALVFLMAGPATNTATLGAVYRTLGHKTLVIYLVTIIVGSILCGWLFEAVIPPGVASPTELHQMHQWWAVASAVLLIVLIVYFAAVDLRCWSRRAPQSTEGITVNVSGMTCENCVAKLERTLQADQQVDAARVSLDPGRAVVQGSASESHVRELIEQAGFHPD